MDKLESQREEILADLPGGTELVRSNSGDGGTYYRTERRIEDFESEETNKDWLIQAANQYVNALRPRLNDLLESQSNV
jgi:hypothetical protein